MKNLVFELNYFDPPILKIKDYISGISFILSKSLILIDLSKIIDSKSWSENIDVELIKNLLDFKFQFPLLETIRLKIEVSDSDLRKILMIFNNPNIFQN